MAKGVATVDVELNIKTRGSRLQSLRDERVRLVDANGAALKSLDEGAEPREMTDEEVTAFDANDARVKVLDTDIDRRQRQQRAEATLAAPAGRQLPSHVSGALPAFKGNEAPEFDGPGDLDDEGGIDFKRVRIPASANRWSGRLKHFAGPEGPERAFAFGQWLRSRLDKDSTSQATRWCVDHGLLRVDAADQTKGANEYGGYWVPEEFDGDIIKLMLEYGVFRADARMSPMASDSKTRLRRKGGLTTYYVGEQAAITSSAMSWDQVKLVAKKIATMTFISNELTADSMISVADQVIAEIAYALTLAEDDAGFNGDGTSTYGGIVGIRQRFLDLSSTRANIAGVHVCNDNVFVDLDLLDFETVVGLLPTFGDTPNTKWYMHKVFYSAVWLRLINALGGITPTHVIDGYKPSILGYPVKFTEKMPKVDANDQIACMLGDLSLAADFGDRAGTSIAMSTEATVNSISAFETDQSLIRAIRRYDINVHDVGNATATAADKQPGPIIGMLTAAS